MIRKFRSGLCRCTSMVNNYRGYVWNDQRWGLLSQFSPFCYFPRFSESSKHWLPIEYHVHIWQVSLQLGCSDTLQIWTRCKGSNRTFAGSKISPWEKLVTRSLVLPTTGLCIITEAKIKWTTLSRQYFTITVFWFKFDQSLFLRVQFIKNQHWFRKWLGAKQGPVIVWANDDPVH